MATSIRGDSGEMLVDAIDAVYEAFKKAEKFGLEVETIATAMIYLKENPETTIKQALQVGLDDWDT